MKFITSGFDENYASLKNYMNMICQDMNDLESSINKIISQSNWESPAKNFFKKETVSLIENFDIINGKFNNVTQYLDRVRDNYNSVGSSRAFR